MITAGVLADTNVVNTAGLIINTQFTGIPFVNQGYVDNGGL